MSEDPARNVLRTLLGREAAIQKVMVEHGAQPSLASRIALAAGALLMRLCSVVDALAARVAELEEKSDD